MNELESERAKSAFADPTPYLRNNQYIVLRAQAVRQLLETRPTNSILDLGCGDGGISIPLAGDSDMLVLVDASRAMLDIAAQRLSKAMAERVQFECQDIATFQTTRQFDVVLCIGLFAHTPDLASLLALISHCVAPGGCAVVQFTDDSKLLGRASHWLADLRRIVFMPSAHRLNHMTNDEIVAGMASHGLQMTACYRYAFLPGVQRLPPAITRFLVRLAGKKPLANCGGEVIAVFTH